jgi:hypothetical protein
MMKHGSGSAYLDQKMLADDLASGTILLVSEALVFDGLIYPTYRRDGDKKTINILIVLASPLFKWRADKFLVTRGHRLYP